jgi:hypothetical protein
VQILETSVALKRRQKIAFSPEQSAQDHFGALVGRNKTVLYHLRKRGVGMIAELLVPGPAVIVKRGLDDD